MLGRHLPEMSMKQLKELGFRKVVKHMMVERNITQAVLGEKIEFRQRQRQRQRQGISQFLAKKDFKLNKEIVSVADLLGYDVKLTLVDRYTGKTLNVDSSEDGFTF